MPQFDAQGLDKAGELLSLLGSFWASTYGGRNQVKEMLYARQQSAAQTYDRWNDTLAALNPETVPISRRNRWYPVRLLESSKIGLGRPVFGGSWQFAVPVQRNFDAAPYLAYDVGALVTVRLLLSEINAPGITLRHGPDFHLDPAKQRIVFTQDPFADPRLTPRVILTDSTEDRELILWAPGAEIDEDDIWRHFGVAFKLRVRSSVFARQAMLALYKGVADGNPVTNVKQFLSAIFTLPLVEKAETVLNVFSDARATWVITATRAYKHPLATNITVSVGEMLKPDQFMTDAVYVQDFKGGRFPSDLKALGYSERTLGDVYFQGLIFENKEVPLIIEPDVNGYTKVSFELGGFAPDIDRFWNEIHANGVAAEKTLAMLLDVRGAEATTQPSALTLPATINPLRFLAENIFRNNGFLVRLKASQLQQSLDTKRQLKHLSTLVPAHVGLVVAVELATDPEQVTISIDATTLQDCMPSSDTPPVPVSSFRLLPNSDLCS